VSVLCWAEFAAAQGQVTVSASSHWTGASATVHQAAAAGLCTAAAGAAAVAMMAVGGSKNAYGAM
jgi:hypothetical protein